MTLEQLCKEVRLSLAEAAELMPHTTTSQTINNWTKKGVRGVVLESFAVGGRIYTTKEALQRFLNRLNAVIAKADTAKINVAVKCK
jgi:hypothetical protein